MNIFDSGVDWVTLTSSATTEQVERCLVDVFEQEAVHTEAWRFQGYRGRRCTETGIRYGIRNGVVSEADGLLVASGRFSSAVANIPPDWLHVDCTRLDLQVTVFLEKPDVGLAERLYKKAVASKKEGASVVGRRSVSLVQSESGSTYYVGKRTSGRKFFRFYDKSIDYEAELGTVWRQEVQFGRKCATEALWRMHQVGENDRTEWIIRQVCAEFDAAIGFSLQVGAHDTVDLICEQKKQVGIPGKLLWLRRCVKPVLSKLVNAGYAEEALKALGMSRAQFDSQSQFE